MNFRTQIAIVLCTLLCAVKGYGQVFWTEDFNLPVCDCVADNYTGVNGLWSIELLGTNQGFANTFYVSCQENGHPAGACGSACGSNPTLHVGSTILGDIGAAYYAGFGATTRKRAVSPIINCSGKSSITINFNYLEGGEGGFGGDDNALLAYFDGTSWQNLADPAKTLCCGGVACDGTTQGLMDSFFYRFTSFCRQQPWC